MRMVVIGLLLLAGFKVWTQDRVYRSVMSEALIEAYRERAVEVCRKQSGKGARQASNGSVTLPWGSSSDAQIVIGNPEVSVALWDTENPQWGERYQHPNLVLTASAGEASQRCAYDLRDGLATLSSSR